MIYKYTYENDIPVECTLTLRELQLLRKLTVEAVKEDGYRTVSKEWKRNKPKQTPEQKPTHKQQGRRWSSPQLN